MECPFCKCCEFDCEYEDKYAGTMEQHSRYICMNCNSAVDVYEARDTQWEPSDLGLYIEKLLKEKDEEIKLLQKAFDSACVGLLGLFRDVEWDFKHHPIVLVLKDMEVSGQDLESDMEKLKTKILGSFTREDKQ